MEVKALTLVEAFSHQSCLETFNLTIKTHFDPTMFIFRESNSVQVELRQSASISAFIKASHRGLSITYFTDFGSKTSIMDVQIEVNTCDVVAMVDVGREE